MTENESRYNENNNETEESNLPSETTNSYLDDEEVKPHPVNSLPPSCRRVKLYEIGSSTDNWVDKGTGYCFFDGGLDNENPKLLVSLEQYGIKSVVSTYIKDNSDYSSQNDSIIIWHEGSDTRLYRALSFQNVLGHNACWSYILNFVDESSIQSPTNVSVQSTEVSSNSQYRILPIPTVASIQKLETTLDTYLCQSNLADGLYLDLMEKKWLKELFELMHKCISNEDLNTTSSISSILLKLLLNWCGSLDLMQIFVSDDVFFDLLKSFEYDMDLISQNIKMEHVKFFKKFVRHHEVVPVTNTTFYQLIHSNYRINYLKDVVLPRHLDEFSIQRINSTVYANMTEIMNIILTEENNFFENLKAKLSTSYMAALFLRELLLVARSSNMVSQTDRNSLILMVRNYQLLNELSGYLDDSSEACKMYKETLLPLNRQSEQYYQNIKSLLASSKTQNGPFNINKDNFKTRLKTFVDDDESYLKNNSFNNEMNNETNGTYRNGLDEQTYNTENQNIQQYQNYNTDNQNTQNNKTNNTENQNSQNDNSNEYNETKTSLGAMNGSEVGLNNSEVGSVMNREEFRPNLLCTSRHRLIEPLNLVIEIFHVCQDIFPAIVRSAVFVDAEMYGAPKLLLGFCNVLLNVPNEGLQSQTREIISRLLDPKNMDLPEKDEICNIFYDKGVLDYLMHYLIYSTTPDTITPNLSKYPNITNLNPNLSYSDSKKLVSNKDMDLSPSKSSDNSSDKDSLKNYNLYKSYSSVSDPDKSNEEDNKEDKEKNKENEENKKDNKEKEEQKETEENKEDKDNEQEENKNKEQQEKENETQQKENKEDEKGNEEEEVEESQTTENEKNMSLNDKSKSLKKLDSLEVMINAKLNIMEILSLCAREHKHRFKLRVQSQKIPLKVIKSSITPYDKFLVVGSLKFLKVCIHMKDKLVNRHIVRYNLLRYVLWILMYKVNKHNSNGSILESICLSLLATIESVGTDALIVYLFEDQYCLNITNKFKRSNSCYNLLFTNLQRIYHTINNQNSIDENKWFEEDDDEDNEVLSNKNKSSQEPEMQENIISLYRLNNEKNTLDDDDNIGDNWIMNKKPNITQTNNNTNESNGLNKKITVKLKNTDEKSIAEEFVLDSEEGDTIN